MAKEKIQTYLTFDDVLLMPGESKVVPSQVNVETKITEKIKLKSPLMSAAMDTVTESRMAIAMARMGGVGVIHRSLPIEKQAEEIAKVKRVSNIVIKDPLTITPNDTIKDVEKKFRIGNVGGAPVVGTNGKLVGMLTSRDIKACNDKTKLVKDFMTKKVVQEEYNISISKAKDVLHKNRIEKLPLVKNGKLYGLITLQDIEESKTYPNAAKDANGQLLCAAAVGTDRTVLSRVDALVGVGVDVVIVDTAHGHSKKVIETVKSIRKKHKSLQVIAGNIVTAGAAKALIKAGVNALKVGVGPGSICTTRVVSGVGAPQFSAIEEVYSVAKAEKIPIIADGGIRFSGDITKALAAGANAVMMGTILAGCKESPGQKIMQNGKLYKMYRGMGSLGAMKDGSRDRYFQEDMLDDKKLVPEGIEGVVPYKGDVHDILYQLVGGLRSGMGYIGAETIDQMPKKARFIRITQASLKENHPHDVIITEDAPNYFSN